MDIKGLERLLEQNKLTVHKLAIGQTIYQANTLEEYKVLEITIDITGVSYLARTKDRRFICFREEEIGAIVLTNKGE